MEDTVNATTFLANVTTASCAADRITVSAIAAYAIATTIGRDRIALVENPQLLVMHLELSTVKFAPDTVSANVEFVSAKSLRREGIPENSARNAP